MARTLLDTFVTRFVFQGDDPGLRRIQKRIATVQRGLHGFARTAGMAGAAAAAAISGSSRQIMDVEKEWFRAFATTANEAGSTIDDLKMRFESFVEAVSRETGQPKQLVIGGIQRSLSAGMTDEATKTIVDQAVKAQMMGMGDARAMISSATTLVTAYFADQLRHMTNDEVRGAVMRSLNAITTAGKLGEGEMPDFSRATKRTASFAQTLGVAEDKMMALLALASRVSPDVSEAATAMSAFFRAFQRGSERSVGKQFNLAATGTGITYEMVQSLLMANRVADAYKAIGVVVRANKGLAGRVFTRAEVQSGYNWIASQLAEFEGVVAKMEAGGGSVIEADWLAGQKSEGVREMIKVLQSMERQKHVVQSIGEQLLPDVAAFMEAVAAVGDSLRGRETKDLSEDVKELRNQILDVLGPIEEFYVRVSKAFGIEPATFEEASATVLKWGVGLLIASAAAKVLAWALSPVAKVVMALWSGLVWLVVALMRIPKALRRIGSKWGGLKNNKWVARLARGFLWVARAVAAFVGVALTIKGIVVAAILAVVAALALMIWYWAEVKAVIKDLWDEIKSFGNNPLVWAVGAVAKWLGASPADQLEKRAGNLSAFDVGEAVFGQADDDPFADLSPSRHLAANPPQRQLPSADFGSEAWNAAADWQAWKTGAGDDGLANAYERYASAEESVAANLDGGMADLARGLVAFAKQPAEQTINLDVSVVNAEGMDANAVGEATARELADKIRPVFYAFDSRVQR